MDELTDALFKKNLGMAVFAMSLGAYFYFMARENLLWMLIFMILIFISTYLLAKGTKKEHDINCRRKYLYNKEREQIGYIK